MSTLAHILFQGLVTAIWGAVIRKNESGIQTLWKRIASFLKYFREHSKVVFRELFAKLESGIQTLWKRIASFLRYFREHSKVVFRELFVKLNEWLSKQESDEPVGQE